MSADISLSSHFITCVVVKELLCNASIWLVGR